MLSSDTFAFDYISYFHFPTKPFIVYSFWSFFYASVVHTILQNASAEIEPFKKKKLLENCFCLVMKLNKVISRANVGSLDQKVRNAHE